MADQTTWLSQSIKQLNVNGLYSNDRATLARYYISLITCGSYLIFATLDFKYNCTEIWDYIGTLSAFIPVFATIIYLKGFSAKRAQMHEIIDIIRNQFQLNELSIEAEEFGMKLVKYSEIYNYFVYFAYVLIAIQSYLQRDENPKMHDAKANGLPQRIWIPFDLNYTSNFLFFTIYLQIVTLQAVYTTIPIAIFFACLMVHLRAQLYHLQNCLAQVCEQTDFVIGRNLLKQCVKRHYLLIDFTEKLQAAYTYVLLFHNYTSSIVMSVTAYQASLITVSDARFLPNLSAAIYVMADVFIYCYYGQQIIDQSSRLGHIAYNSQWYNVPPDIGRNFCLIITRSQKALGLLFLGSTNASLETFYEILKIGYSYFLFLANLSTPEKQD